MLRVTLGGAFFLIPLYPSFITLTPAPVPGVSVIPRTVAIALLAFLACAVATWIALLARAPRRSMPTVPLLAAFPAAALVSAALGFEPFAGLLFVGILAGGVVWHAAILRFFGEPGVARTIFAAYLISGALASLAAIVMVLTRTPLALWVIQHGRATGTFVVPGELAGYLVVYLPLAFALARSDLRLRAVAIAGLVCAAAASVMTFSRAGWAGLAAALAMLVVLRGRERGKRSAATIVVAAAVVLAALFNAHHDPSENFTRLSIWQASLGVIARFPLTGVGPFAFPDFYPFVRVPGGEPVALHAHNVILTVVAETGLVGLAALALGWWGFAVALRGAFATAPEHRGIAAAIAAALLGTWVQGIADTSSVVIFGLWLPMMALALAPAAAPARASSLPRALVAAGVVLAIPCAVMQLASSAVYSFAAAPQSLPAHLPPALGTRTFEAAARVVPLPVFDASLATSALARGDVAAAKRYVARLPESSSRDELAARIARAEGDERDAAYLFLRAGDDAAVDRYVRSLMAQRRTAEAGELELRLRETLERTATKPNALAESWWESGRLAQRAGRVGEAQRDYARASELAPLNTKYLLDAARLAESRHDTAAAGALFARAVAIDPRIIRAR